MNTNSKSTELLESLASASSLTPILLFIPLFFTLIPWSCMFFQTGNKLGIEVLAYSNISAVVLTVALTAYFIYRKKLKICSLWAVLNIAFVVWWVNLVPVASIGNGGENVAIITGMADILLLICILALRVLRTIDIRTIYNTTIFCVVQIVYVSLMVLIYAVSLFHPFV